MQKRASRTVEDAPELQKEHADKRMKGSLTVQVSIDNFQNDNITESNIHIQTRAEVPEVTGKIADEPADEVTEVFSDFNDVENKLSRT